MKTQEQVTTNRVDKLYELYRDASDTERMQFQSRARSDEQRLRQQLLAHYAKGRPQAYYQLDGLLEGDHELEPDDAGDVLMRTSSWELRHSGPRLAVRLFIHTDTRHADAVRLVEKMLDWLKRDPEVPARPHRPLPPEAGKNVDDEFPF